MLEPQKGKTQGTSNKKQKECNTCEKSVEKPISEEISHEKYSISYFEKDMDYQKLYKSYYWISQTPDKRAERDFKAWSKDFSELYHSFDKQAKENGVLDKYNEVFDAEYQKLLKLQNEIISLRSRTFSTFVTGGAGISASKQRKNEAVQKQEIEKTNLFVQKFNALQSKLEKIAKNTPENQFEKDTPISSTDKHAIEKLEQKLQEQEAEKDFILRANKAEKEWKKTNDFKVFSKHNINDELANQFIKEIDKHGMILLRGTTNINAEIRRIKQRIEMLKKQAQQENKEIDFEGGKIVFDMQEHRIKIYFDEIPSKEIREAIKKRAFKWSPINKVWQRVYTSDAEYSVKYLFERDNILKKKSSLNAKKQPSTSNTNTPKNNKAIITNDGSTKLDIRFNSNEEKGVGAKRIKELYDRKLSKLLYIENGFLNTNDFNYKCPKISKKGVASFSKIVVGKDDLRAAMSGVLIEKEFYVGTDAFKLVSIERPKNDGLKTGEVYLVNDTYFDYLKKLSTNETQLSEKEWEEKYRYYNGEQKYPDYKPVIPLEYKYKSQYVDIEQIANHAYCAYYLLKHKTEKINIGFEIEDLTIFTNAKYLFEALQCLQANGTKNISFEVTLPNRGILISSKENKNFALVMPFLADIDRNYNVEINPVRLSATLNKDYKGYEKGLSAPSLSGLAAPRTELSTDDFKKMTVSELRKFTLDYYNTHLKGKKTAIKNHLKEVVFVSGAGRKLLQPIYKEKVAVIEHLEQLIKNSTYNNWGNRKKTDSPDVLGYLNFKSKITIDGEKRHVRISVILDRERKTKFKTFEVGTKPKKDASIRRVAVTNPKAGQIETSSQGKNTKKSVSGKKNDKNFGLGLPLTDDIRKKAFTDKGKLRKGWYYDEYGLLTDGKEFYHSDKKSWAELENIRIYAVDKRGKQIDALYKGAEMKKSLENDQMFLKKLDFEEKLIKKYQIAEREFDVLKQFLRNVELGRFDFYFPNSDYKRWFKQNLDFRKKNEFVEKVVGKDEFHLTDKGLQMFQEYKDFSDKLNAEIKREYNKYKQKYGLSAPQLEISTEDFKNMSVKQLREYTLQYYLENLKGKRVAIKNFINEIVFTTKGGRKLHTPMYKEKAAIIKHLEELIKNSTYNNFGQRKATDSKDVLGYLNFKSKLTIDGEKKHIRISIILDHNRDMRFKSYDVGGKTKKKNPPMTMGVPYRQTMEDFSEKTPKLYQGFQEGIAKSHKNGFGEFECFSDSKNTKNIPNSKKNDKNFGLSSPMVENPSVFVENIPVEYEEISVKPENQLPVVASNTFSARRGSLAQQLATFSADCQSYTIGRYDMKIFLGDIEIKEKDSLVITLTGGQGSGKTRFAFQFMNDLAQHYKVGHISMEEHPQSRLYIEKVHQYLNEKAMNNIEAHDVRSIQELHEIIERNDVIVIDSFQKIKEIDSKFEVDKDLRKKYNSKLFLVIFQQTTDGKMRGGSKSQFDGDIILFTAKLPNYQENYVYPDKNRYNHIPANRLKYNIFQQSLLPAEGEEQTIENQVYDVIY
ncbi:hypothetical protein, partial [Capnocytophaga catalasegens]|uniref:Large polyvalent protein-associated domain-containing protein n=2 Tax=Capnocytophaga catalasegens TaxID=1004260 RepID=A0AAV5AUZ4_9FLAO